VRENVGEVRRWFQPLPYPYGFTHCVISSSAEDESAPNHSARVPIERKLSLIVNRPDTCANTRDVRSCPLHPRGRQLPARSWKPWEATRNVSLGVTVEMLLSVFATRLRVRRCVAAGAFAISTVERRTNSGASAAVTAVPVV